MMATGLCFPLCAFIIHPEGVICVKDTLKENKIKVLRSNVCTAPLFIIINSRKNAICQGVWRNFAYFFLNRAFDVHLMVKNLRFPLSN